MVYNKTNWNPYDETKSEQENIENNAVVTAEKMNHLEEGLVAHENDKSNIHAVTAAQTGAYTKQQTNDLLTNAITEVQQIDATYNFKNKAVGNVTTNVHRMDRYGVTDTLRPPTLTNWVEATQQMYDDSRIVDSRYASQGAAPSVVGSFAQINIKWNIVGQVEKDYPNLFNRLGLTTIADKARWLRNNSNRLTAQVWGRGGSMPAGQNRLEMTYWTGTAWDTGSISNTTDEVKLLSKGVPASALLDDGYVYILCWGKPTDGIKNPTIALDAVQFDHGFKIDMSKFYVPQTQTATATQAGIARVIHGFTSTDILSALSAAAGKTLNDKIEGAFRFVTEKPASDLPATYKNGITIGNASNVLGYPIPNYGNVLTIKQSTYRVVQYVFPKTMGSSTGAGSVYIRTLGSEQTEWGEWLDFLTSYDKDSLVNVTDNQTIGGIKNFTAMPKLNGVDLIDDTGWVDVPYDDDWESYGTSPGNRLKIRRVGKEVMLTGTIKAKKTISASGNLTTRVWVSKVLPDQFKIPPGVYCGNLQQSSGNNMVYQSVDNATNKVYFERNRNGAGSPLDYNEGYWYPVNLRWLVN